MNIKINIDISEYAFKELFDKCGILGITVEDLISNFVSDLSIERNASDKWLEQCFCEEAEPTLLNHLLTSGYAPEEYLELIDNIDTAKKEKAYLQEHPDEANEEAIYLDDDIDSWECELNDMCSGWKHPDDVHMEREYELIREWIDKKNKLLEN